MLIVFCGIKPKIKADDGLGWFGTSVVIAGVTYVGYKAWSAYKTYSQDYTFAKAQELLKQASFWGNAQAAYSINGQDIINAINTLALQKYKPALYFQAEHPWLFVDAIISEFAPSINESVFYARYAPYSIEKYITLATLGDVQGYARAGNLGIAWLYIKYAQGLSYGHISHEVREYMGYLDAAACLGDRGSVNEIVRIYKEGLLVKYNQNLIARIPAYYHTIQQMNNSLYPISTFRIWLFKNYYQLVHFAPVAH
jgi:hypothetical protein